MNLTSQLILEKYMVLFKEKEKRVVESDVTANFGKEKSSL